VFRHRVPQTPPDRRRQQYSKPVLVSESSYLFVHGNAQLRKQLRSLSDVRASKPGKQFTDAAFEATGGNHKVLRGNWQPPDWNDPNSMGMEFRIVQRDIGLSGSVHFRLARGEHQAKILNPKAKVKTFLFGSG
jgi:hypothetical protein